MTKRKCNTSHCHFDCPDCPYIDYDHFKELYEQGRIEKPPTRKKSKY